MARIVLQARIVTMGDEGVLDDGCVYLDGSHIRDVRQAAVPAPADFAGVPRLQLPDCDVLPGLLDLHNHAPYNAFPLWRVPQRFEGRGGWRKNADYIRNVRDPAGKVERKSSPVHLALARYVEIRSLMGGATSLQGLSSTADAKPYIGLVRNVEHPVAGSGLPGAGVQVMDLKPEGASAFLARLARPQPLFFHLAEGKDVEALGQAALMRDKGLLHRNLVCIHCLGLTPADHQALRAAGSHVVWSPLSNLLLYGQTLDVAVLAASSAPFALACDWTPSGSRNLLQELKVAWLVDRQQPAGARLGAERLARAVTVDAAKVAQCDKQLGVIADGFWSDLLILKRRHADPFENLISATEREVQAVMVNGQALYGDQHIMRQLHGPDVALETVIVGDAEKALFLPEGPGLRRSTDLLRAELGDLASPGPTAPVGFAAVASPAPRFKLRFDMDEGQPPIQVLGFDAPLNSVPLAPLTVVDDLPLFDAINAIAHVPAYLKGKALREFYEP